MKIKTQPYTIRLKKRSWHLVLTGLKALYLLAFCGTRYILDLVLDLVLITKKANKIKAFPRFGSCPFSDNSHYHVDRENTQEFFQGLLH